MTVALDPLPALPTSSGAPGSPVRRPGGALLRRGRFLLALGATVVLLVVALPAVAGVAWSGILLTLSSVPVAVLAGLVALWAAGLALHTITLTAALPGLSAPRAATLSLTGSAVANVLPVGGAAGTALNVKMARAWGFDARAMSRYTVVTNVWDVLAKVALPAVAIPVLLATGVGLHQLVATGVTAAVGAVALGAVCVVLLRPRSAALVGRWLDRLVTRAGRGHRPSGVADGPGRWERRLVDLQVETGALVRRRWGRLSVGMALYTGALLALMTACFAATGAGLPLAVVVTAFVLERLLTLAGLTPGGAGLVEVAVTGLLVSLGAAAGTAAAGILLYRGLTMALEVPVGGTWLLLWSWGRLRRRHRALVESPLEA